MSAKVSGLLLAAGRSSRMGGPNKLLLDIGGEALVHRTAREILRADIQNLVIVTGHQSDQVLGQLQDIHAEKIYNENFFQGMHTSIRAGISKLPKDVDAFFICLADQPDFTHLILNQMIELFSNSPKNSIIHPSFKGERGHPVLISAEYIPEILAEPDRDSGCNYLFKRHPEKVIAMEVDTESVLTDIDQPQDYQAHLSGVLHAK